MKFFLLILLTSLSVSCNSLGKKVEPARVENSTEQKHNSIISQYVVETFQDSKGNLWFGTLEDGVAKYDGTKLTYLTIEDGLPSNRVVSILEDKFGRLWFGTDSGFCQLDGETFTYFSEKDGLCSNMISELYIDTKGIFWIGTWGGVCKFNGAQFENFQIPYPIIETPINPDTKDWITTITEDSKGHIWFGRDGYGASKFDGNSFVHYTTKDGLNSNNVQSIAEDKDGGIWIGTRVAEKDNEDTAKRIGQGGINKLDGETFIHFPDVQGFSENDVYTIYKDNSGNLWFSTTSHGVYKCENDIFVNYAIPKSTMSFLEDTLGNVWIGCAGGLFRIKPTGEIRYITTDGPWS